jgi:hypothetical protein
MGASAPFFNGVFYGVEEHVLFDHFLTNASEAQREFRKLRREYIP